MTDNFRGDNANLISSINALLELDAEGALVPHGIGGHARALLTAAASRLSASIADTAGAKPVAWQYKDRYGKWEPVDGLQVEWHRARGFEVRSLYAAPPAPSVADADRRKELTEALGLPTNGIRDGKKAVFGWDYLIALVRNLAESEAPSVADEALMKGEVRKEPCFICGSEKSEAHHPDYKTPLDVVWLCRMHHRQTHALIDPKTGALRD